MATQTLTVAVGGHAHHSLPASIVPVGPFQSVRNGDAGTLHYFLKKSDCITETDEHGLTLLHVGCRECPHELKYQIVKRLIEAQGDLAKVDKNNKTPFETHPLYMDDTLAAVLGVPLHNTNNPHKRDNQGPTKAKLHVSQKIARRVSRAISLPHTLLRSVSKTLPQVRITVFLQGRKPLSRTTFTRQSTANTTTSTSTYGRPQVLYGSHANRANSRDELRFTRSTTDTTTTTTTTCGAPRDARANRTSSRDEFEFARSTTVAEGTDEIQSQLQARAQAQTKEDLEKTQTQTQHPPPSPPSQAPQPPPSQPPQTPPQPLQTQPQPLQAQSQPLQTQSQPTLPSTNHHELSEPLADHAHADVSMESPTTSANTPPSQPDNHPHTMPLGTPHDERTCTICAHMHSKVSFTSLVVQTLSKFVAFVRPARLPSTSFVAVAASSSRMQLRKRRSKKIQQNVNGSTKPLTQELQQEADNHQSKLVTKHLAKSLHKCAIFVKQQDNLHGSEKTQTLGISPPMCIIHGLVRGFVFHSRIESHGIILWVADKAGGHDFLTLNLGKPRGQLLLKPLQTNSRGENEVRFFEALRLACDHGLPISSIGKNNHEKTFVGPAEEEAEVVKLLQKMYQHVPQYYGIVQIGKVPWLVLEHITAKFEFPCVLDIKIGCKTYTKMADRRKINNEVARRRDQGRMDFRVTGMVKCSSTHPDPQTFSQSHFEHISVAQMPYALLDFFAVDGMVKNMLMVQVRHRLDMLVCEWLDQLEQRFEFVGCSLLIAFDAGCLEKVDVRIIDFGNTTRQNDARNHVVRGIRHISKLIERAQELQRSNSECVNGSGRRLA